MPFTLRHLGADAPAEEVAAFLAAWQASGRFAYHVALQPGGAAGAACRGVSVAFSADQAVYLAVAEAGSAAPQRLAAVKRVMETGLCFSDTLGVGGEPFFSACVCRPVGF